MEDAEGQKVKNKRSTGEEGVKGGSWVEGGKDRRGSYGNEGSSSRSGVLGCPCMKEMKATFDYKPNL